MRLAVIDCGTNTFNLIVIDVDKDKKHTRIFNSRIPVKLGEGAINEGYIAEQPYQRGIEAIKIFREVVVEHKVDKVLAFATSAIRDASNGQTFVDEILRRFDISLAVIDGEREAELIYLGIREAVPLNENISLIMDIGGGSTELILASKNNVYWKGSFRIGAARLLEKFAPSNPISISEVENIHQHLNEQLESLFKVIETHTPVELIGSSGAFDSIVEMIHGELNGEPLADSKTAYEINIPDYFKISQLVQSSTIDERKKIRGLTPIRFDMIVISCLMVDFILKAFNLKRLRVSVFSLKEGALYDHINGND